MQYILLSELAKDINLDKSHTRRYVREKGFQFIEVLNLGKFKQTNLAISVEDAEKIKELRTQEKNLRSRPRTKTSKGTFYILQLCPDVDPYRVKFGYTMNLINRLNTYRTSSPTCKILCSFPCKPYWERIAIEALSKSARKLSEEVYQVRDIGLLSQSAKNFFKLLPQPE